MTFILKHAWSRAVVLASGAAFLRSLVAAIVVLSQGFDPATLLSPALQRMVQGEPVLTAGAQPGAR